MHGAQLVAAEGDGIAAVFIGDPAAGPVGRPAGAAGHRGGLEGKAHAAIGLLHSEDSLGMVMLIQNIHAADRAAAVIFGDHVESGRGRPVSHELFAHIAIVLRDDK